MKVELYRQHLLDLQERFRWVHEQNLKQLQREVRQTQEHNAKRVEAATQPPKHIVDVKA